MNNAACYESLPAIPTTRQSLHQGHDRMHALCGELQATVHLCQPLHIGSGLMEPPALLGLDADYPLVKSFFHIGNQRIIPGTSLKGAFRSLVELFTASCVPGARNGRWEACKPNTGYSRHAPREGARQAPKPNTGYPRHEASLCPACRLFGAFGFQGFVTFEDTPLPATIRRSTYLIPPQYQGKTQPGERRYYPHNQVCNEQASWPLEVLDAGQTFTIRARFEGVDEAHLGLLLIALGQGQWHLCPKLGGGKNAGLGCIEITVLNGKVYSPQAVATNFDFTQQSLDLDDIEAYLDAALPLIDLENLNILAVDLARPRETP